MSEATVAPLKKSKRAILAALSDPRADRAKSAANQKDYWTRFGVTQSGGSRYENLRDMPKPLQMLMALRIAGRIDDKDLQDLVEIVGGE